MISMSQKPNEIHGSIVVAICKIKQHMEAVAKSQRNLHGNYNFASTDDIYAALSRKMGDVGLISVPLELKHEMQKTQKVAKDKQGQPIRDKDGNPVFENVNWLHVEVGFVLATKEATWMDPTAKRSLFIQYTGPQTHQSAVSFAEKAWLRSLFKLPTGDMDLDSLPQGDTEEQQVALNQPQKRKSSSGAKKDGTTEIFNEIRAKVASATSADWLQQVRGLYAEEWQTLPAKWVELLDQEYEDKMDSFGTREAAE
jgi:hypothetical protein